MFQDCLLYTSMCIRDRNKKNPHNCYHPHATVSPMPTPQDRPNTSCLLYTSALVRSSRITFNCCSTFLCTSSLLTLLSTCFLTSLIFTPSWVHSSLVLWISSLFRSVCVFSSAVTSLNCWLMRVTFCSKLSCNSFLNLFSFSSWRRKLVFTCFLNSSKAVSYTHLDVYKRQVITCNI